MVTKGMMVVTQSSLFFNGVSMLLFLSCFMAVSSWMFKKKLKLIILNILSSVPGKIKRNL